MPQTLQLFASHLSRTNILTLKVFLGLTKTDEVARWEYTDDQEAASALLIDADSEEGNLRLKELASKNKRQVLIAFSSKIENFPPNVLVLPRPLRSAELIPVLRQASKQFLNFFLEQERSGSYQVIRPEQADEKAEAADATSAIHRVLDVLYNNQGRILKVIDRTARTVVFDVLNRRYYTADHTRMEVEDLIAAPTISVQIEEFGQDQFVKSVQYLKAHDLDPPLWVAALAISNGRLFGDLSSTEFYRLNRWPDLKKLGQNSLHLKLTALLRRGGTIDYFANFLKVPANDVIDYINACRTLNYLENQEKSVPLKKMLEHAPSNTSKRSLFSRIRSRLGI